MYIPLTSIPSVHLSMVNDENQRTSGRVRDRDVQSRSSRLIILEKKKKSNEVGSDLSDMQHKRQQIKMNLS